MVNIWPVLKNEDQRKGTAKKKLTFEKRPFWRFKGIQGSFY